MRKNSKNARVKSFHIFCTLILMDARRDFCDFFQRTHIYPEGRASTLEQEFRFLGFFLLFFSLYFHFPEPGQRKNIYYLIKMKNKFGNFAE
jgi:hypothetical protein